MSFSKRFSDANFEYFHKESQISSTDESSEAYIRILGTKQKLCIRLSYNLRMYVLTSSIRKVCNMAGTIVEEQAIFLFQSNSDEPNLNQQIEKPAPPHENISIPVKQVVPPQQQQPQFQQPSTIQPQMQPPQVMYQQPIQGQPQTQFIATPVNNAMNPYNVQQPMMQQQQFINPQMNYSNSTSSNTMFVNSTNSTMGVPGGQTIPSTSGLKILSIILIIIGIINVLYFAIIFIFVSLLAILNFVNLLNGVCCITAGILGIMKANNPLKSSTPTVVMASVAIVFTFLNIPLAFFSVSFYYSPIWYNILLGLVTIVCEIILIVLAAKAKPQFGTQKKELFLEMKGGK